MNDNEVLRYLLNLGVERLLERNPDFSFDRTNPQTPPLETPLKQVPASEKIDNQSAEDEEWERRFGK